MDYLTCGLYVCILILIFYFLSLSQGLLSRLVCISSQLPPLRFISERESESESEGVVSNHAGL